MRDSTAEVDGPGGAAEHVLHTAGVLGIKEDVTTSGLLLHARRIGMGTSPAVAGVVRQQAVADSKELQAALQQVWRWPPVVISRHLFTLHLQINLNECCFCRCIPCCNGTPVIKGSGHASSEDFSDRHTSDREQMGLAL